MPLSDFVRYLNTQHPLPGAGLRSTTPFVSEAGRVFVNFANLRLESYFSPIIDTATGKLTGHAAGLYTIGLKNHQLLEPEAVFVLPGDDAEFIYLDRLVRTLHALNYLTYLNRHARGTLLLKVHPRHVASVAADHGLAFEEVLRACGLLPKQITLEIEIDGVDDAAHLVQAIASYKSRGYGIAVGRFGRRAIDFNLLQEIRPSIVKFDPLLFSSTRPLQRMVDRLHELGAQVMIGGLDAAALRRDAQEGGFDLLQVNAQERAPYMSPESPLLSQAA
ncbi:EAL domain-containing protein [Propionivibrio sp.]|uniref:EAL domain-containing protein n=1 Tax=Propionivibrio sp. TaxID=2212460 RepID=UPI003BF3EC4C